jgi:hypothetical protein
MTRALGACVAALILGAAEPVVAQAVGVTGTQMRLLRDARVGPNRVAVLTSDLLYCYPPTRELIVVPRSYMTDFASVPTGAHHVIDRYGDNMEAAIVHDWLYAVGETGRRQFADEVFRYALGEQGVSLAKRNIAYRAVRAGGERAYGSDREWSARFYDPDGAGPISPPFDKPYSAAVTVLDTCDRLESTSQIAALQTSFGSQTWARRQ